ncbi:MAG: efflux RND transporter periplasmic adaptor subunit [Bacteroidales bacterium]|nr:efflux RND transporter periplasmic adaptor subunit [Bacteroidales bacterium]
MKKIIRISVIVLFLGVFVWTIFFLVNKSKDVPVVHETTKPEYRDIIQKTVATGSVVPENEIDIIPQVSGIIEEIYVKAGDKIKKGDLIAKVRIIPNIERLNAAKAQVDQAKIALNDCKTTFERKQSLFKEGVISKADFQKIEYALEQAQENLAAAENHLSIVKDGISKDAGKATNTLVSSTIGGMVLDVPVEVGNSVIEANTFNQGTVIAKIADMRKMIFKGTVDETEVGKIKTGMKLLLNVGAIDNHTFDAKLTYISPKGKYENSAIVFDIEAEVQLNDSVFIRAGYSANADIVLARKDKVLTLEEKNLLFEGDTVLVEIEKDSLVFEKQSVKLGLSDGIYTEIVSGIDTNTKIKVQK